MKIKILKLLISCLLSSFMLFAVSCTVNSQESSTVNGGEEREGIFHFQRVEGKDEYCVVGIDLDISIKNVVVPNMCKGLPVTEVGSKALSKGIFYIKSVVIGDNVIAIRNGAFDGYLALQSIVIGKNVAIIEDSAFEDCYRLTSVEIPDSVISIGSFVFIRCYGLESVVIGDGVNSIGDHAFYDCDSLTSIVIGESVTSIGEYAFVGCISLTSVYYKGTTIEWEEMSIGSNNENLTNATRYYYVENEVDVPSNGDNYWHYNQNGEIEIWS